MAFFDRFRKRGGPSTPEGQPHPDADYLAQWAEQREGVEGFVEPRTTVTPYSLLLVAKDGEWTRRVVPSPKWAHGFCNKREIPSYDAAVVGVPARMREYNRREKKRALDELRDL